MPKVNKVGSGHVAPVPNSGWQWLTFENVRELKTLNDAIFIIGHRIKGYKPCEEAFKSLPGGKTFKEIWTDPGVWISRDPQDVAGTYGATLGSDITISRYALRMGRWTAAATLVHELAHVDGADGVSADAENTLLSCLLVGLRDPTIIGALQVSSPARLA